VTRALALPLQDGLHPPRAGESLVAFSDGVTESLDSAGRMFGETRLLETLGAPGDETAIGRVEAVRRGVRAFAGDAPAADDLTVLVVRLPQRPVG
jgi:serine phosphatase RsbU (regulator of sigma subunit)